MLIVLGMLAFIVASAVGFAAYMRYSRLPSSYLRRTSASRLLAKAALAEAIDIIDNSIGNSAYPGKTGKDQTRDYRRITDDENNDADVIDYWQDRCFIGSNALVSVESTVSTLCTEALAYIPPPIVNEVRYYSRRSLAAQWHTLGFDAGRFAFCAVDVSDYFDVNRTFCNPLDANGEHLCGRNSSDAGRITLAHLFENESHTGPSSLCSPDKWDDFVDGYLADDKVPFVSLADLSLAMRQSNLPDTMNPFCNFIRNGANFVTSENGPEAEMLRNMCFVTDSCYVTTNRAADAIDLSRRNDQPFAGHERDRTVQELIGQLNSRFRQNLAAKDSPLRNQGEILQLYDYLDEDSVPVSLAVPTVERTPMITGVSVKDNGLKLVVESSTYDNELPDGKTMYKITTYTLKLIGSFDIHVGRVYPFKYDRAGTEEKGFQMQAAASVSFVEDDDAANHLRYNDAAFPSAITCSGNWQDVISNPQKWELHNYIGGERPSVLLAKSQPVSIDDPDKPITTEADAVLNDQRVQMPDFGGIALASALPATDIYNKQDTCTFRSCKKYEKDEEEGWKPVEFKDPTEIEKRIGWLPSQNNMGNVRTYSDFAAIKSFRPTIQVWVRIYKGEHTVDLVPACWKDDMQPSEILQMGASGASQYPFLRFCATSSISVVGDELKASGDQFGLHPAAYMIDDPRFNFAPENFVARASHDEKFKDIWLNSVSAHAGDRDGDIFMETSDAGYLQSVYELAFIQQISRDRGGFGAVDGDGYNGNAGSLPAKGAMWRTYSQYDNGSSDDEFDYLDVISGSRGARVSPYAQSENIVMAALANTPLNWWAASTNETVNTKVHGSDSTAAKYSFSEKNGATVKVAYDNLEDIAGNMIAKFRGSGAAGDWRRRFDDAGWWDGGASENGDTLCGVTLDNAVKLHSVDRKFLHGFWKECFENRQQLFLVFVRAEPMMMGGGGMGQTPPQLGARAVALVWRDPAATRDDVSGLNSSGGPRPHRTRILFYRQFD